MPLQSKPSLHSPSKTHKSSIIDLNICRSTTCDLRSKFFHIVSHHHQFINLSFTISGLYFFFFLLICQIWSVIPFRKLSKLDPPFLFICIQSLYEIFYNQSAIFFIPFCRIHIVKVVFQPLVEKEMCSFGIGTLDPHHLYWYVVSSYLCLLDLIAFMLLKWNFAFTIVSNWP